MGTPVLTSAQVRDSAKPSKRRRPGCDCIQIFAGSPRAFAAAKFNRKTQKTAALILNLAWVDSKRNAGDAVAN
jgi:hypothetical protein